MKKKLAALLAAVLVITLALTGCTEFGRRFYAIRALQANRDALTQIAEDVLKTGQLPEDFSSPGVRWIDTVPENGWVSFTTDGTSYDAVLEQDGLYYSPNDQPMSWRGADRPLDPDSWQDQRWNTLLPDGASYMTRRLQENWFYFEYHDGKWNEHQDLFPSPVSQWNSDLPRAPGLPDNMRR